MAIDLTLAFSTLASGTRTNSTIARPTGVLDGDFLLAAVNALPEVSITLPSGWTQIVSTVDSMSRVARTVLAYKRASSEPADWTWTHASSVSSGFVWRLTGVVASGDPEDCTRNVTHDNVGINPFDWPSITTNTDGAAEICIGSRRSATSGASSTSLTERVDFAKFVVMADLMATAGVTGLRQCNESATNDMTTIHLALKPAAAASFIDNTSPILRHILGSAV